MTEKQGRQLRERIVDLEDEVKKLTDQNNSLSYQQTINGEEFSKLKAQLMAKDKKLEDYRNRLRDNDKMK